MTPAERVVEVRARPWLRLYGDVLPYGLEPAPMSGLETVRGSVVHASPAPLVHYFDAMLSVADVELYSDRRRFVGQCDECRDRSEVEDMLYEHPAVREAPVVGVPDPRRELYECGAPEAA